MQEYLLTRFEKDLAWEGKISNIVFGETHMSEDLRI